MIGFCFSGRPEAIEAMAGPLEVGPLGQYEATACSHACHGLDVIGSDVDRQPQTAAAVGRAERKDGAY